MRDPFKPRVIITLRMKYFFVYLKLSHTKKKFQIIGLNVFLDLTAHENLGLLKRERLFNSSKILEEFNVMGKVGRNIVAHLAKVIFISFLKL